MCVHRQKPVSILLTVHAGFSGRMFRFWKRAVDIYRCVPSEHLAWFFFNHFFKYAACLILLQFFTTVLLTPKKGWLIPVLLQCIYELYLRERPKGVKAKRGQRPIGVKSWHNTLYSASNSASVGLIVQSYLRSPRSLFCALYRLHVAFAT